jgi:putative tricarboxylic transport membrane protein
MKLHNQHQQRGIVRALTKLTTALGIVTVSLGLMTNAAAWQPTKSVEFVVPAGSGGGADQMARFIQGVVTKNKLMKQPMVVVNKSGGAGMEGFLYIKGADKDPHKIIITLSNLFTTPLATGVPFNWKEITPVQMMALDQFVLWVNADTPYKTAGEYIAAVKAAGPLKMKMGGTGSRQEDQIITVAIEKQTGVKFTYIPYKGGGEVAVQLVGKHVDSTVNNPIEAVEQWRAGKLRPLCVFDTKPMPYKEKITATMSWNDIPTCDSQGLKVDYLMLRGIFMSPGVTRPQIDFYIDLLKKVRATPEWQDFLKKGAFDTTALVGAEFNKWLGAEDTRHFSLMTEAGFLAREKK